MTLERWNSDAKKVGELALREALSLGHNYIGPEHLLLALLRTNNLATDALRPFASPDDIRGEVIDLLAGRRQSSDRQHPVNWVHLHTRLRALDAAVRQSKKELAAIEAIKKAAKEYEETGQ